jgi:ribonuclease BN (tRNA processing enzyme)
MAEAAGVSTLVLNHLLPGAIWEADDETYLEGIRRHYQGEVIIGEDQLVI